MPEKQWPPSGSCELSSTSPQHHPAYLNVRQQQHLSPCRLNVQQRLLCDLTAEPLYLLPVSSIPTKAPSSFYLLLYSSPSSN
jgi:hypothetical protein